MLEILIRTKGTVPELTFQWKKKQNDHVKNYAHMCQEIAAKKRQEKVTERDVRGAALEKGLSDQERIELNKRKKL